MNISIWTKTRRFSGFPDVISYLKSYTRINDTIVLVTIFTILENLIATNCYPLWAWAFWLQFWVCENALRATLICFCFYIFDVEHFWLPSLTFSACRNRFRSPYINMIMLHALGLHEPCECEMAIPERLGTVWKTAGGHTKYWPRCIKFRNWDYK